MRRHRQRRERRREEMENKQNRYMILSDMDVAKKGQMGENPQMPPTYLEHRPIDARWPQVGLAATAAT